MAGISVELTGMYPLSGIIGEYAGFPVILSVIDISMDKYTLLDKGNRDMDIIQGTEVQRFIVPFNDIVEM